MVEPVLDVGAEWIGVPKGLAGAVRDDEVAGYGTRSWMSSREMLSMDGGERPLKRSLLEML